MPLFRWIDAHRLVRRCIEVCDVCGTRDASSSLQTCCHCGIHVHPLCYSISTLAEDGHWWCLPCRIYHERQRDLQIKSTRRESGGAHSVDCKVCPEAGGAYDRTPDSKGWIHTICNVALSDPVLKTTAVHKKCSICGKLKGKVFPCQTTGCTAVMHVPCCKAAGKLTVKLPTGPHEKPQITSLLCPDCAMRLDIKEGRREPVIVESPDLELRPSPLGVKRGRSMSHLDGHLVGETSIPADDDLSSGRMALRNRPKRSKSELDGSRSTNKRGRPANPHRQRRRLKKELTVQGVAASADGEPRRMTRSMK